MLSFPTNIPQHPNAKYKMPTSFQPLTGYSNAQLPWVIDPATIETYYGATIQKAGDIVSYHVSAPIITGLTGGTDTDPFVSHVINMDFTGFTEDDEEDDVGATPRSTQTTDYIRFCFGESSYDNLQTGVINPIKLNDVYGSGGVEMTRKQVYNLEFTNQYIMLVINTNDGTEVYKVNTNVVNYQIRSMFQIKYGTYDNEFGSFQRLAVQMKLSGQTVGMIFSLKTSTPTIP